MKKIVCPLFVLPFMITACTSPPAAVTEKEAKTDSAAKGIFACDLAFLRNHDSVVVLSAEGELAHVIVSPKYQAKVFTSTADGDGGKSFGWINYKAFTAPTDAHMNAYGGENRFWLGPEGGVFSLFFTKGKEMVFDNWKTPPPIDTEPWTILMQRENSVHLQKDMKLVKLRRHRVKP